MNNPKSSVGNSNVTYQRNYKISRWPANFFTQTIFFVENFHTQKLLTKELLSGDEKLSKISFIKHSRSG
jgi:hypothetical protein